MRGFHGLFDAAVRARHGSMLVVAADAEREAERLQGQGTRVEPVRLTPDLYQRVSRIDGTVIIDPRCVCHAVGVILDGAARPEGTPARGARYNSGMRYVRRTGAPRLAIIVSDDQTVDVIPLLRPRIRRSDIGEAIEDLEAATHHEYHDAIHRLDRHRFYLTKEQCNRVNDALGRIGRERLEGGEIRVVWKRFSPNPELDDSYFEDGEEEA